MISEIMKLFDRNTVIAVLITAIIALFYSSVLFYIYILSLILLMILKCKWDIIGTYNFNNGLKNIAVTVVTIFTLTLLAEIWLQLYPHRFTGIDGVDTVGEFSDYTSRGYLTEDVFNKKKGVIRILGLGDSFSVYLRDKKLNYINILQDKFVTSGRGEVEIVNAGMEAMGPGYYWQILRKLGDSFKPDLVLVGFFVGNDFEEETFSVFIGNFINEPKDLGKRYSKYYRFRSWRLHRLVKNKYTRYREEQRREVEVKHQPAQQVGTFSQETYLEIEKERSWIFDKNKRAVLDRDWRGCAETIRKMKAWCDQRQIKLVIAILPEQFQVDRALREAVLTKYKHIAAENLDLTYPDNLIVNLCRTHDIHCLDLLGPFQEEGKTRQLYSLNDSHWNEAGNRLAADLIFQYLEKNQLLPPRPGQ
jgi:hypothetical protein